MSLILGMDTGGTYTDAVIVDADSKEIRCKAKALTTKEELYKGIENSIRNLDFFDFEKIGLVSISTTLATNAIVEGRGGNVGLLYFGEDKEYKMPTDNYKVIKGRFDIMGNEVEPMDEAEIKEALLKMMGSVEAIAISGYASVRNPKHEQRARQMARELLGLPVVCAHELTAALGFEQRTITAVLNAKLLPLIEDLLKSTRKVLDKYGINAPIMIVKGDGSLMPEKVARERPIETILSGPAASVIGGAYLTKMEDAFVLDMGGTTTDIAYIENGAVKIKKPGAKVGGWATRVQAAEISTFGIGGDSRIYLDSSGRIRIGPQKVTPLCVAGKTHSNLLNELNSFKLYGEMRTYSDQEADCYLLVKKPEENQFSETLMKLTKRLEAGPHSLTYLANAIGENPEFLKLTELVEGGYLARIAVTPTDILHVLGKYNEWDQATAQAGIEILAKRLELSTSLFIDKILTEINQKLCIACIQSISDFEEEDFNIDESVEAMYLLKKAFGHSNTEKMGMEIRLKKPIIAIGAPAFAWMGGVSRKLNVKITIPEHAEVANAVGAAVGQMIESLEILISKSENSYILNLPWERTVYGTLDEALFYAIHEGRKHIEFSMVSNGYQRCQIAEDYETINKNYVEGIKEYAGTRIKLIGVSKII